MDMIVATVTYSRRPARPSRVEAMAPQVHERRQFWIAGQGHERGSALRLKAQQFGTVTLSVVVAYCAVPRRSSSPHGIVVRREDNISVLREDNIPYW